MSGRPEAVIRPAFSRPLAVEDIPPEGLDLTVSATAAERDAIAAEDGLERLAKLEGSLRVLPWRKDGVAVSGEMRARITQICVVTLDPFDSEIVEPIDVKFAPTDVAVGATAVAHQQGPRRRTPRAPQADDTPHPKGEVEGEDPPDPIIGGRIDLGAVVAEFLALALDPYPRKPGVEFEGPQGPAEEEGGESPFSKLQVLRGILPS